MIAIFCINAERIIISGLLFVAMILMINVSYSHSQVPPTTAFSINRSNNFVPVNYTDSLYFIITNNTYKNYDIKGLSLVWNSSNDNVASVDINGVVTGENPGKAIITAQSSKYDSIKQQYNATVFTPSIPIAYLNVQDPIQNEPKVLGDLKVIDADGRIDYDGKIGIEIRGSSTRGFPKKQYSVETRNPTMPEENLNVSLLGFPKENDWIFYAEYSDKTLLRDVLAYDLFAKMGRYCTRFKFFEVYLNGDYQGVYILFEKIKRDKNRVNIAEFDSIANPSFIIKRDKFDGADNEFFETPYGGRFQFHYPKPMDITEPQRTAISNYIRTIENALYGSNFKSETEGYRKYIDVDSWIDYLLMQFISYNNDGYYFSNFMHRDRGGKFVKGPIWDFNISFGNINYGTSMNTYGWVYSFWYVQLMKDEYFRNQMLNRWRELRKDQYSIEKMNNFLDSTSAYIKDARIRNFQRWPILGSYIWPNFIFPNTYEEEMAYFKRWLNDRVEWIDAHIDSLANPPPKGDTQKPETIKNYDLNQNYPNPFNPFTTIKYQLSSSADIDLTIFNALGQAVRTLVKQYQAAGKYSVEWDGRNESGAVMPTGLYFYRLKAGNFLETRKMVLMR